jgi:DNA-binding CsgD family transcriptional regulator
MDDGDLEDLVESLYDLALEPDEWPRLLRRFAGAIGASAGALMLEDMETGAGGGLTLGLGEEVPGQYFEYYALRNVLRRIDNPRERLKSYVPIVTIDQQMLPKDALMRTEFYADFLRPAGIHSALTVGLWSQGVSVATIDLFRPASRPSFEREELRLAETLHPHLVRAFRLGRKVAEARALSAGLADALDRAPYGLLLLGADGRVRHLNAMAERLVAGTGSLRVLNGRLTAPFAGDHRRLSALIAAAAGPGARSGGSMAVRRWGERAPLSVAVAPMSEQRLPIAGVAPTVMVCVTDPDAACSVSEAFLGELFGLTGGQAKVAAALLEGRSPRQAAEALGLSFYTVRAHLTRIFEKTGVNRQAELVALMTRALSGYPAT